MRRAEYHECKYTRHYEDEEDIVREFSGDFEVALWAILIVADTVGWEFCSRCKLITEYPCPTLIGEWDEEIIFESWIWWEEHWSREKWLWKGDEMIVCPEWESEITRFEDLVGDL
jgi:hypothetical protein